MAETKYRFDVAALRKTVTLCPEQMQRIRSLWNTKALRDIAVEIGESEDAVNNFAKTHYLYFNYLR